MRVVIRVRYLDAQGRPVEHVAPTDNPILAAMWLHQEADALARLAVLTPAWGNPPSGLWPKAPETPSQDMENGGVWPAVQEAPDSLPPTWDARWNDNFKDTV